MREGIYLASIVAFSLISCTNQSEKEDELTDLSGFWKQVYADVEFSNGKSAPLDIMRVKYLYFTNDSIYWFAPPSYAEVATTYEQTESRLKFSTHPLVVKWSYQLVNDTLSITTANQPGLNETKHYVRVPRDEKVMSLKPKKEIVWDEWKDVWVYSGIYRDTRGNDYGLDSLNFKPYDTLDISANLIEPHGGELAYYHNDTPYIYQYYDFDKGYLSLVPVDLCGCVNVILQYERVGKSTDSE